MTLSKERLKKIASWREIYGSGHNVVIPAEEAEAMARELLERRERDGQEPVAWIVHARTGDQLTQDGGYVANAEGISGIHSNPLYAAPQAPDIGDIRVGRLPTMNQDEYPGLGDWWVQLRIGEDVEEVLARVYGATPQEANNRAEALACRAAMHGSTISNSADIAIDDKSQWFGNSEQLNSPAVPDGWIKCSERLPEVVGEYVVYETLNNKVQHDYWNLWNEHGNTFTPFWNHYGEHVTHWQPLPAAPKQESE